MNKVLTVSVLAILIILFNLIGIRPVVAEEGCSSNGSPMTSTDNADYGPFEVVTISGSGFGCGVILSILVLAPNGSSLSGDGLGSAGPDVVTTDANGAFVLSYQLSGTLPDGSAYMGREGNYTVNVLDATGAVLASTIFSDSGGWYHSCALTTRGTAKCWGSNVFGQLGDGTTTQSLTPVNVTGLSLGTAQISVAERHTCALTMGGGAKCWGDNSGGKLGDGTFTTRLTPVDVIGLTSGVAWISAGQLHTCAVTISGGAKCWGINVYGQLGDSTNTNRLTPVDVIGLTSGVTQISAGERHTCALTTSGGVKCWGFNQNGQLGDGTTINRLTPMDVSELTSGVIQISAGQYHTCALMMSGGVKCWGYNVYGQLGDGTTTQRLTPVEVSGLASGATQITAGGLHSCALTTTGGAKCWGNNGDGRLGDGTFILRTTPGDVNGLTSGVTGISANRFNTCALVAGGAMCWGYNGLGAVGDGTTTTRLTPVGVYGMTSSVAGLTDTIPYYNQPPTADAGGPYQGGEGAVLPMSGASASDPDWDPLIYTWSVDSTLCSFDDGSLLNPNLTCSDNGSFTVTLTVDDGINLPVSSNVGVVIDNVAPATSLGNNSPIDEGSAAAISINSATDPSSDDTTSGFHYAFDCNGSSLSAANYAGSGVSNSTNCVFADNGSFTVSGKIMDDDDGFFESTTIVIVNNVSPTISAISVDLSLVQVNNAIYAGANFTDPGIDDTHFAEWNWGDGTTSGTVTQGAGTGSVSDSHSYSTPGVYTILLTVTDNDGASSQSAYQYVVVYDPYGGYVSGSGSFWSAAGACQDAGLCDLAAEGKAMFGFVSKYKRGANVPSGNTHFKFHAGGLSFDSQAYEWLVVNQGGGTAQFKGSGQVNGDLDPNGNTFKFMVWAKDGSPDTFRIRIWWEDEFGEHGVYDNGFDQPIDQGRIVLQQ